MAYTIVENVRGFFISRPPLVVFMICLGSFAIALITFAYLVKVKDMPNPDITEDWNTFLDRLSNLDYCVVSEPGATIRNASQVAATVAGQGYKDQLKQLTNQLFSADDSAKEGTSTTTTVTPTVATNLVNVSVLMDLELMATENLKRIAARHNFTFITTTLRGGQLGLIGDRSVLEANVTVVLPPLANRSHHCQHGQCYKVTACVIMTAPPQFFPHTQRPDVEEMCRKDPDLGGENHFHLEVAPSYLHCVNASILSLDHQYDPTLTVMLTMDRSVINLHLMHTSYFLFVMMVTLLCYAIIKGRPSKVKVVYMQCSADKNAPNQV